MNRMKISSVLASQAPKSLARFYAFVMDAQMQEGLNDDHWVLASNQGQIIEIFRPSRNKPFTLRGRVFALCIHGKSSLDPLSSIRVLIADLISKGAFLIEEPKLELFGAESWLADPEGNQFLLVVPIVQPKGQS